MTEKEETQRLNTLQAGVKKIEALVEAGVYTSRVSIKVNCAAIIYTAQKEKELLTSKSSPKTDEE